MTTMAIGPEISMRLMARSLMVRLPTTHWIGYVPVIMQTLRRSHHLLRTLPHVQGRRGWPSAIGALAVAECTRSPACALSDVPREHRDDWAAAIAEILKWLFVVSDLLLHKPQRGGARARACNWA